MTNQSLTLTSSAELSYWLSEQRLSLAFTTYQTNRLYFVGSNESGLLKIHERLLDKPMGLFSYQKRLYLSTRYQLWEFDNILSSGEKYGEADCLYIPRTAHFTGDLNIHDVVLDSQGNLIFVNTDFSCLSSLSQNYSFIPSWKPPFISKLVPEDRCHLNGLAMVEGKPAYMTACSATDTAAGWRNHRSDGGVVIDVAQNEIIVTGLSMPHSPRWYQGKLWLLNSGTGELGYIEENKFIPVTFCPGFVRGLAFWGDFAFIGLSKLRSNHFTGLSLENRLMTQGETARCGLIVINLKTGKHAHWLYFDSLIEELFDVVVLPGVRQPQAIGLQGDEIQRLVTFPESNGIVTTKPTVKRPSIGKTAPIAGLPQQVQEEPKKLAVKYQRVYHLNQSNAIDYDDLTYPSLQQRWQKQPPRGELLGISASVDEGLVGFVIAERASVETADIISLLVIPECRRQGIATKLLIYLEKELKQQGCQRLTITYESSTMTTLALEPILKKLGWHSPTSIGLDQRQSYKSLSSQPPKPPELSTPKVSLVMTVYNAEAYLKESLDSVLAQTYGNWELILWDDGSTDNSVAIAQSYAQRDPRIRFQQGTRLGRVKALKNAHNLTKGEYVGWLDADDRLAPEALAETVTFLDNYSDYGMVYTNHIDIDPDGNPKGLGYRCQIPYQPHRLLIDLVTFHFRLFRKSVFDAVGGINARMQCAEDYDVCLKIEEKSKIYHLEKPLYFYRIHPESITQQQTNLQREWSQWAVNQALERRGLAKTYKLVRDEEKPTFSLKRREGTTISDTAKAQFEAGKQLARQGNLEGAIANFTEAIRLAPNYVAAYNQLGNAYQQLGQTEKAIATYQHLLSINPNLAQAHCNLGAVWQVQGKFDEAASAYQKAIELKPDLAVAYLNLGKLQIQLGDWEQAQQSLEEACRLQPNLGA